MNRSAGERQTNLVQIYLDCGELLELCRKAESGELLLRLQDKKQRGEKTPLYQCMGGTSAEKLRRIGRPRPDGKSLSRIFQLLPGNKSDFLLVADSGPGETDEKGLIVPRFGKQPENHVVISLSMGHFCELLLLTRAHYLAWLTASYSRGEEKAFPTRNQNKFPQNPKSLKWRCSESQSEMGCSRCKRGRPFFVCSADGREADPSILSILQRLCSAHLPRNG